MKSDTLWNLNRSWRLALWHIGVLIAIGTSTIQAKPPSGGGGSSSKTYSIIDLVGPHHQVDGNHSYVSAQRLSDPAYDGTVYVLGSEISDGVPCLWRIDAQRNVTVVDLGPTNISTYDLNSAGIVAGEVAGRPAVLLPDQTLLYLEDSGITGEVKALSNPNLFGVFQAVGDSSAGNPSGRRTPVLWDITVDGTVLARTPLIAANGQELYAWDINDQEVAAGVVVEGGAPVATYGEFDSEGVLQLHHLPNPDPTTIKGYWDMQIDEAGNMLAFGYETVMTDGGFPGTLSRAVIWPATGGAIDLGAVTGMASTEGNGIARVAGVMQVVGRAEDDGRSAFAYRYSNGRLQNLNSVSSGAQPWILQRAAGVNRAGMICGLGRVGGPRSSQWHGFLLIPNP